MSRVYVARAELVLARPDTEPLSDLGLKPDPLQAFAGQFDQVRADLGEEAAVVIDVLPATPRQQQRLRQRLMREAHRRGAGKGSGEMAELFGAGANGNSGGRDIADTVEHRYELRQLWAKLGQDQPLFAIQILIRAESEIPGRAEARVKGLEAGFRQLAGQNHFKALGLRIPGVAFLGADMPWRRWWFDRRFESGLFHPGRRSLVNASEIAGFLKPPTRHCAAANVARVGGVVPPAPRSLPTFKGQADLLPIGKVTNQEGDRLVGVPLKETFFSYVAGRSRYGKALALDTPIPTPDGWTTMGALKVGDRLFDDQGRPCQVTAATEVQHDRECFEVVFSDGARIVADADHRWLTTDVRTRKASGYRATTRKRSLDRLGGRSRHRGVAMHAASGLWHAQVATGGRHVSGGYFHDEDSAAVAAGTLRRRHLPAPAERASVVTTTEIRETLRTSRNAANHAIPTCRPLEYPERPLPVDPYVLGLWLGEGTSRGGRLTIGDRDAGELLGKVRAAGYTVGEGDRKPSAGCATYPIGTQPHRRDVATGRMTANGSLQSELRALGVLGAKHIPRAYLETSYDQRLALLQGLMDADGSISPRRQCELGLSAPNLAADARELLLGLGIKVGGGVYRSTLAGRETGHRHRMTFTTDQLVFALERKRQRLPQQSPRSARHQRYIVDVVPVESVPVRCITVDSPARLYLAGRECIPTHNTELGISQFLHLVRTGHGGMFIDPHEDAITRIKGYLTDQGFADRVVELNLAARGDSPQPGWNLLSMEGSGPDRGEMAKRVRAVTTAFSSALGWGERNTRALNLTTQATQSLTELAFVLPPQLQPTIFQLTTILGDDDWRAAILPHLSRTSRDFWEQRFPRLGPDAITPITNPLDTLYSSPAIKAMLGSSRSSYDIRRAMDEGKIVLACLGSGDGEIDNLMANFLVSDLIRAARDRVDTPPEKRKPFYLFLDELQIYDGPVAEQIAAILEQTAKYGLRLFGFNQDPSRLSKRTFQGLVTNRSHLLTTVVSAESAARLAREWGGTPPPDVITKDLERYQFLAHVTLGNERPAPFRLQGAPVGELFGEPTPPEGQRSLEEAIDRNTQRRPPSEVTAELEELPERILEHLAGRPASPAKPPAQKPSTARAVPAEAAEGEELATHDEELAGAFRARRRRRPQTAVQVPPQGPPGSQGEGPPEQSNGGRRGKS